MGRKQGKLFLGTSGWHYKHWNETFYPKDVVSAKRLSYYAGFFDSVEINNAFYRLPTAQALKSWYAAVPRNFTFALKGSRFITHMKKLSDPEKSFDKFFKRVVRLKEKLGPVLFQLPPWWGCNLERLDEFLTRIPRGLRYAFEFRERSWLVPEVYRVLKKHHAAICIYDLEGFTAPLEVTADFVYLRFHGPKNRYRGSYSKPALKAWLKRVRAWQTKGLDVYWYFDNDEKAYAIKDAKALQAMLAKQRGPRRGKMAK